MLDDNQLGGTCYDLLQVQPSWSVVAAKHCGTVADEIATAIPESGSFRSFIVQISHAVRDSIALHICSGLSCIVRKGKSFEAHHAEGA